MQIKIGHFCGLSSSTDFRNWLKSTSQSLYDELINNPKKNCKSKQEKMTEIYKKLYDGNFGPALEEFMSKRFSYMIESSSQQTKNVSHKPKLIDHIENLNKHEVFKKYRPDLLSFPHKRIIVGDPSKLPNLVKEFIVDKIGIDYIIIDGHAYIEYFARRYSDIAERIKKEDREIWAYRQRIQQNENIH
jgi:hypothetical protein